MERKVYIDPYPKTMKMLGLERINIDSGNNTSIVTPANIAKDMVALLPDEVFIPESKFLDICCKSGIFLTSIRERLMNSPVMIEAIPDYKERYEYITNNQLYGIAPNGQCQMYSVRAVYGTLKVDNPHILCFGAFNEYKSACLNNNHKLLIDEMKKEFGQMKFDVVIGNPPYQETTGGGKTGKTAKSLYTQFMDKGLERTEKCCILITPSKWFNMPDASDTRNKMIKDGHLVKIVDYINSKDVFGGVDIAGGVSYFLHDKSYIGDTEIISHNRAQVETYSSDLRNENIIFRSMYIKSILRHLKPDIGKNNFSNIVSGQTPFGLNTNYLEECSIIKTTDYNIRVVGARGNDGYTDLASIKNGLEYLDKYKVITNHVTSEHAGETDKNGMVRVISKSQIIEPNEVCTQTYMIIGYSDQLDVAKNIQSYIETKFVRLLIWLTTTSISLSPQNFKFIPMQDFSRPWTDQMLYEKYNLTEEEINYIEQTIKPM